MKIRYKRSGGIANVITQVEIDSSELPENLQNMLKGLTSSKQGDPIHSDDFFHELELEDGRTIRCTDSRCPPTLLALFDTLQTFYSTQSRQDAKKNKNS